MAEFHKNGSFEPLLWNCAATAARINRKAVYSVDIILESMKNKRIVLFFMDSSMKAFDPVFV